MHVGIALLILAVVVIAIAAVGAHFMQSSSTQNVPTTSTPSTIVSSSSASTTIEPGSSTIKHIIVIVLENGEYSSVINNSRAPYENILADRYALAADYFAVSHPSEPNYVSMIAGSTLNITNDGSVSQNRRSVTNLVDLFRMYNVSWKSYQESMPVPCDVNNSADGLYATKHNPFVYMTDITGNITYCQNHVVGLDQFYGDLAANALPQYSFVTPNMKDDGHDTNTIYADDWLSNFVPRIINSSEFNSSAVIITYDEGLTSLDGGGHIATIMVGPPSVVKPGASAMFYNHYSLLATVERIFGLGTLGRNDANATVMNDVLITPI